jgi:hypothetical protein
MQHYIADLQNNPLPAIEIDQIHIHIDGDTAVVSCRSSSRPGRYNRYIDTYSRTLKGWLCVHASVWPLPESAL